MAGKPTAEKTAKSFIEGLNKQRKRLDELRHPVYSGQPIPGDVHKAIARAAEVINQVLEHFREGLPPDARRAAVAAARAIRRIAEDLQKRM
jgi:hypothetical protein